MEKFDELYAYIESLRGAKVLTAAQAAKLASLVKGVSDEAYHEGLADGWENSQEAERGDDL